MALLLVLRNTELFGNRVAVTIDGVVSVSGGPNAMDLPLSYISPMISEAITVDRGVASVSKAPESMGGHISAKLACGQFREDAVFALSGLLGSRYNTSNDQLVMAGRLTAASNAHINFTVEDLPEPPVIESVNITSQGQSLSISGVVTDPDGDAIDSVQLFFNGSFTPLEVNFVGGDGSWTNFDSAFAAGTHQVWVREVDDTGRISGTVSRDFSIAVSTPPVLSNISITKQGQEVIIRGRAVDAESDLSAVELRFDYDASQFPPTLYVFTPAGDWEYRRVMSPGDHTITIRARDAGRNFSNSIGPLSFNIPEATTGNACVEDFIMMHMAAGRAVACGVIGTDVCAAGSGGPLPGILSMEIVSLSETSANVWQRVGSCS